MMLSALKEDVGACRNCCKKRAWWRLESCGAGKWDRRAGLAGLKEPLHPRIGSGMKTQLQTTLAEFKTTQTKLMEQESALKELQERGES